MIPKRVVLENFLTFSSPAVEFDFAGADEALWVITGPNGCGKSAVFDAITYALFECHRGSDAGLKLDRLARHGADHFRVILEFDFGGRSYRITRGRSRAGKKMKPDQKLEECCGGTWRALPPGDSGDSLGAWVEETLGLNYDSFTASVLLKQGDADKLLSSKKEDSLKILKGIIGFEQYESLAERVKEATSGVRAGASLLKAQFATLDAVSDAELAESADRAEEAERRRVDAGNALGGAIERTGRAEAWEKCGARRTELDRLLADAGRRSERAGAIRAQRERGEELGAAVPLLESLVGGRAELADLQERLDAGEAQRRDTATRAEQARTAAAEARTGERGCEAAIAAAERTRADAARELVRVTQQASQVEKLEQLAGEVSRYPADAPELAARAIGEERSAGDAFRLADRRAAGIQTVLDAARAALADFGRVEVGVKCSRCGNAVSVAHAELERTRMAEEIARAEESFAECQSAAGAARIALAGARTRSEALALQANELTRAADRYETLRASLIQQGCTSTLAELSAERVKLAASETAARADAESAGEERRRIATAAAAQEALAKSADGELAALDPRLERARTRRDTLLGVRTSDAARLPAEWANRWMELTGADVGTLGDELAAIRASGVDEEFRQLERDGAQRELWIEESGRIAVEIAGIPEADRIPARAAEEARTLAVAALAMAEAAQRSAHRRHEDATAQAETHRRVSRELHEAQGRLALHESLDKLVGKDGIQLDLVRGAEAEVIALADDTLRRLSNQELSLEADDEATGRDVKAFALRVRKAGEAEPTGVDFISGSQRFRVAVSLALALGRFASGKQRPLEAVIIDEGFGSLDKDGLRAMAENLHELRRTQSLKRIILVSHQESFTDQFATGYRLIPSESGTTAVRIG